MLNAEIYSIAKLLLPLHEISYLYLFGKLNTVFASNVSHPEQLAIIDKLNEQGANIISYTLLQGLDEFLYFEFTELLKQGLRVRKCRHCDKYFVLKSRYETFYCDRISGKNKTCKIIGNKLEYQKKVSDDVLLQCYERQYKANHAKTGRASDKEMTATEMGKADALQRQWSKHRWRKLSFQC